MGESAQEVWDRVVERARKERSSPKESDKDRKDPYEISRDLTFFGKAGEYVNGRRLSEEESDARYAKNYGQGALNDVKAKRELARRMGYDSVGEMNYYERPEPDSSEDKVYKLARSYAESKNRSGSGDIGLDPSVEQYYRDDRGRDRVMLLPKMQYMTNVNQQRIQNEMADRAFEAQQEQLRFENERRLAEFEAAQRQQEFANQMAQRQFGLQEGQLTGRYRSQDVSNLLNQLATLKQQGSVSGKGADYYSGLKSQADVIRNQLAMRGYDTSGIGANATLQDFYKAAGQMYNPTLGAQELNQRGQQFAQEQTFRQQQAELENAFRREQFERSKFESDRGYNLDLARLRIAQAKASQPREQKVPKVSKQQTYADALAEFKQQVEAAKKSGNFQGAEALERQLLSDPQTVQSIVSQGYDLDAVVDALYNASSNGQWRTKKEYLDFVKQVTKKAQEEEEEDF